MRKIYIQDLYDLGNCLKDIAIEAEEELDEDVKGPTILKSEVVKPIKDMQRKKVTGDDNILVDLLNELGDRGLKIMTALVNKTDIKHCFLWLRDLDTKKIESEVFGEL